MSTTKSQNKRNNLLENTKNVSVSLISLVMKENLGLLDQDILITRPSIVKFLRIERSALEKLRASLKEEIIFEINNLLIESQKEMERLLWSKTGEDVKEEDESDLEKETRSFYTPTKSVRINSSQYNDPFTSRNNGYWMNQEKLQFKKILFGEWYRKPFTKESEPNKIRNRTT